MKKPLSPAILAVIAAVAVVLIGGAGFLYLNKASGAAEDKKLEQVLADQAKNEYSKYSGGNTGQSNGPPVSSEGDAQAAYPGGKPAGN